MPEDHPVSAPLRDLLTRGAGLHTAELSRAERRLVERLLAEGHLRCCVTTTTLAEGVNLPFRTVVAFEGGRGWWRPSALRHLFGRAGRPGSGPGLTVLAGHGLKVPPRRIAPEPHPRPGTALELLAMALTVEGPATPEALLALLRSAIRDVGAGELDFLLQQGRQYGLWDAEGDAWHLLPVGRLLADGGVQPETLAGWRTMLRRFPTGSGTASLFFLALGAAAGTVAPVPLDPEERQSGRWTGHLARLLEEDQSAMAAYFGDFLRTDGDLPRRLHQAAKAVALLLDWREGTPPEELSAIYRFPQGLLEDFVDTARFLLGQLRRLGAEMELPEAVNAEVPAAEAGSPHALPAGISPATEPAPPEGEPELVICEGTTGEVLIGGKEVSLTPRQFRLLEVLARRAGEGVPYEQLERHVWPDAQVERQQISYHRRVLEQRLRREAGWSGPLIETRPAWGLRLCLGRDRIRFRNGGNGPGGPALRDAIAAFWFNSVAGEVRV